MSQIGMLLFMTFLSIYGLFHRKKTEEEAMTEEKKRQEQIDNYYKRDLVSIKKLVTRYKHERSKR